MTEKKLLQVLRDWQTVGHSFYEGAAFMGKKIWRKH